MDICYYKDDPYVYKVVHSGHRPVLAQFHTATLPLAIETGRYNNIPLEYKTCTLCVENATKGQKHFIFDCKLHERER